MVSTATSTFSNTANSDMALTTWPNIGRHPKIKLAATKTASRLEITFERKWISTRFQWLHCTTFLTMPDPDMTLPTSAGIENQKCRPRIPALSVQKLFKFLLFVADIFASACRPISGRVMSESDMVENVGIAAGIASKSYFYFRFWWPPF